MNGMDGSGQPVMHRDAQCSAAAERWLATQTTLPRPSRQALATLAPTMLGAVPEGERVAVGIAGSPGSGKSTLARFLAWLIEAAEPGSRSAVVLSLDDYYLPLRERERLARERHPLLRHRGVPGTHDWRLLLSHLDRALAPGADRLELPRFDKGSDDRLPASISLPLGEEPRCVLLEGWVIGAPPQAARELSQPVNELENRSDPDGTWRSAVNEALAGYHHDLEQRLGARWYLRSPGWTQVIDWRWRQERELPREQRRLRDRSAVIEFLAPFERCCQHMDRTAADWADLLLRLDRNHRPTLETAPTRANRP
jgi:D-glycerate 3-kinase